MVPMDVEVVIADQDVKLAKLYCRFLADHGISAETATCGLECLAMARKLAPEILVLDRELAWGDASKVLACFAGGWLATPRHPHDLERCARDRSPARGASGHSLPPEVLSSACVAGCRQRDSEQARNSINVFVLGVEVQRK
jgi:hypothetical protein